MIEKITLKFKRLDPKYNDIELPRYHTPESAGMDIRAAIDEPITLKHGEIGLIPTSLAVEIPKGYELQVRPRSGLALHNGIIIPNSPATIDSDYRGELKIIIMNLGGADFVVHRGDRIAQLVISKIYHADIIETDELSQTERGEGGFHSTGRN
ncbi:MAG TPA: dUTP diphosphatase [Ignavibacteriales bacterium]|mgnify:CR=1 FL=1|nr:dUTP diphosphatase [Ignavibacteriales bacterium]HOL81018.1 dUTP diphosphatase [Ignavibacteriales bacterium]HOM64754.1 dUTP diphosphatase [Ignavibacteriales bacterium]HPD66714.1 dUTP diphosphatase [Ignavibacteriales bacterium]HPP32798.1 dUTP diphosphatase [Ignavibacteriales bacterium]